MIGSEERATSAGRYVRHPAPAIDVTKSYSQIGVLEKTCYNVPMHDLFFMDRPMTPEEIFGVKFLVVMVILMVISCHILENDGRGGGKKFD